MGKDYTCSSFDNTVWGFKRVAEVNPVKIKCKNCGWGVNFYIKQKKLCPVCKNYVYPDEKEEFRVKVKRLIKWIMSLILKIIQ